MGLWTIDNAVRSEYERRAMRRHHIRQWLILIVELLLIAAAVLVMIWIAGEVRP